MPLDEALGIVPYQQSSEALMRLGCVLSVLMPFAQARAVLGQWSGLTVSAGSLWNSVQQVGQRAEASLAIQGRRYALEPGRV